MMNKTIASYRIGQKKTSAGSRDALQVVSNPTHHRQELAPLLLRETLEHLLDQRIAGGAERLRETHRASRIRDGNGLGPSIVVARSPYDVAVALQHIEHVRQGGRCDGELPLKVTML